MVKKINLKLKRLLLMLYLMSKKGIKINIGSIVILDNIQFLSRRFKHTTVIHNSSIVGNIEFDEGCILSDVTCTGNIKISRFVSLNGPGTRISSRLEGIEIGAFTSIASNVVIQEDYHRYDKVSTYMMNKNIFGRCLEKDIFTKGMIIIEEDVWIGSNSVILSGVKVGRGAIIAAGSVVTKDIPRYAIVAGNPAQKVKMRFDEKVIQELENSKWWEMTESDLIRNKDQFNKNLNLSNQIIDFK